MLTLESTAGCPATLRVLFALEELGAPYAVVRRPEGYFYATHGRTGPLLVDGELALFEGAAILRHVGRRYGGGVLLPRDLASLAEMDAWIDFAILRLGIPIGRLVDAARASVDRRDEARVARETASLARALGVLERGLAHRDHLVGDFGIADCAVLPVLAVSAPRAGVELAPYPSVAAYADRVGDRPAFARAIARATSP